MRFRAELALYAAAIGLGAYETGVLIERNAHSAPPQIASAAPEIQKPEIFEEYMLTDFFKEAEKLKDNPRLFVGRKFKVTLDQSVFTVGAIEQQELKSKNGENLKNYILQAKIQEDTVRFLVVNVPESHIGTGAFGWPPIENPPRPGVLPKKTVIEMEGIEVLVNYQASLDKSSKLSVPVLVVRSKTPPPPEKA